MSSPSPLTPEISHSEYRDAIPLQSRLDAPKTTGHESSQSLIGENKPFSVTSRANTISFTQLWRQSWILEALSCAVAGLSLFAIIITLRLHENKPLPQWPSLISINSLVAVFTAIFKTSLLLPVAEGISQLKWLWFEKPHALMDLQRFDAASRGPWGALWMIFLMPRNYLAVAGAIIVIAVLAVDPFSQQVIRYYTCPRKTHSAVATISKANNYSSSDYDGTANKPDEVYNQQWKDMLVAIYNGLLTDPPSNATASVSTNCPTGNCTFAYDGTGASYMSLGMCSSCNDTTSATKFVSPVNASRPYSWSCTTSENKLNVGETPEGSVVVFNMTETDEGTDWHNVFGFKGIGGMWKNGAGEGNPDGCFAFTCEVWPCVKTYGYSSISQGILQESVLDSTRLIPYPEFMDDNTTEVGTFPIHYTLATNRTIRNGIWHDCPMSKEWSATNPTAYIPDSNLSVTPAGYYPADCVWDMMTMDWDYLRQIFQGKSEDYISCCGDQEVWTQNLWNNGTASIDSVSRFSQGLADSMTANIRKWGDYPKQDAVGTAYVTQTCIQVQWAWLSLPAALLLLAVAFLVGVAMRTKRREITWKSSSLPLLFHAPAFSESVRDRYGAVRRIQEMEDRAKEMRVQLVAGNLEQFRGH